LNKAFNQIKNKPAIIYFIYLYEQKRTGEDTKDYERKINKLRGLAGNIPNFNREHYEKQNLKDLETYIYNNLVIYLNTNSVEHGCHGLRKMSGRVSGGKKGRVSGIV